MTYLALLLVCLLPPIGLLAWRSGTRNSRPQASDRHQVIALIILLALAVLATLPWDAALIARGIWSYPRAQPVGWVAGVPVEELLFMVLQPLLAGLWLRTRRAGQPAPRTPGRSGCARAAGVALWLLIAGLGVLLARSASGNYLGLLLAWSGPLLALQWAIGGDTLWAQRRRLALAVLPPVLYLCAVDRLGLQLRLWQLSGTRTTGLQVLGLPLEEALFFLLTTLLVVGGLLLGTDQNILARLRSRLLRGPHPTPKPIPAGAALSAANWTMSLREVDAMVGVVVENDGPPRRLLLRPGGVPRSRAPRAVERARPASTDRDRAGARTSLTGPERAGPDLADPAAEIPSPRPQQALKPPPPALREYGRGSRPTPRACQSKESS